MVIYDAYVNEFIKKCETPRELVDEIRINLMNKFGIRVAENEQRSWANSLPRVAKLLIESEDDFRRVLIEFNIPTSKKRIDFIILGKNKNDKPSAWLLELKQWSDVTEKEWNEFRVGRYTDSHPSDQANDYKFRLNHEMGMSGKIDIKASAYLHNLNDKNSPLLHKKYDEFFEGAKMYYALNEYELSNEIDEQTIIRNSEEAFELFKDAKWMPTEKFRDIVRNDFKNITLVGTQKLIYEKICNFITKWDKEEKMTFIISGDPGSGKTIVAFKIMNWIMSELYANGEITGMQLMLPGQEVRKAFMDGVSDKILSSRISGANAWKDCDMAIIDEGHKAVGRDYGQVNYARNFKQLKFVIVLIDDDQVINRNGITKGEVIEIAKENGHSVKEYNIEESFRNSGERLLIDWIKTNLYMENVVNGDFTYEQDEYINENANYKLWAYGGPKEFTDAYFACRAENASTRMASLWTENWHLGPANEDGNPEMNIKIGNEGFAWNPNEEWLNALKKNNSEYVNTYNKEVLKLAKDRKLFLLGEPNSRFIAYYNHVQGFEFENIFVYIPNILTFEEGKIIFHRERVPENVRALQLFSEPISNSKYLRGRDPYELNKRFFLNRVKVLMTRGTKTTHIYAEDNALNEYICSKIK